MKTYSTIFVVFCFLIFLSGCSEAPFYENVQSFDGNEWKQTQKPTFEVDITDIKKSYDFVLTVRTSTSYKYNNLWIFWATTTPDGQTVREPFELKITNPDGSWHGNNSGTIVENQLRFSSRRMPLKGKYKFIIEQGITQPSIDNVLDIGFKIEVSPAEY